MKRLLLWSLFFLWLGLVAFGTWVGWEVWNARDFDRERPNWDNFCLVLHREVFRLGRQVEAETLKANEEFQQRLAGIDWKTIRTELKLSDGDLEEYKKSLDFLYQDTAPGGGSSATPGRQPPSMLTTGTGLSPAASEQPGGTGEIVAERKEPDAQPALMAHQDRPAGGLGSKGFPDSMPAVRPAPLRRPAAGSPIADTPASAVVESSAGNAATQPAAASESLRATLARADDLLARAKALNRMALPDKTNYQKNLKEAVALYQASRLEYLKAAAAPGLSATERQRIEDILSKIQQQIYWGKKFGKA